MHDDGSSADDGREPRGGAPPTPGPGWLTALVREHYTAALRHAMRLLRDRAEAEDSVQEAFAEAFLYLGSLRDPSAAPAWLRSIVRHRCARAGPAWTCRWRRRSLAAARSWMGSSTSCHRARLLTLARSTRCGGTRATGWSGGSGSSAAPRAIDVDGARV